MKRDPPDHNEELVSWFSPSSRRALILYGLPHPRILMIGLSKRFQFSLDADDVQALVDELKGSIEEMEDAVADESCTKRERLVHRAHQQDLRNLVRRLQNHARKNHVKILS